MSGEAPAGTATNSAIRLAAIDDDTMLIQGIGHWLERVADIVLVASASTVPALLARGPAADVTVLDLHLRDGSRPADNVVALTEAGHRVLVVSTSPEREHVLTTMEAGASGYVTKDGDLDGLARAIREVAAGEVAYSRELVFAWLRDDRPQRPKLSEQERELLRGYASGLTLATAGRRIGVQPGTAKGYLERIKAKYTVLGLPASTKLELAERAREDGLTGRR